MKFFISTILWISSFSMVSPVMTHAQTPAVGLRDSIELRIFTDPSWCHGCQILDRFLKDHRLFSSTQSNWGTIPVLLESSVRGLSFATYSPEDRQAQNLGYDHRGVPQLVVVVNGAVRSRILGVPEEGVQNYLDRMLTGALGRPVRLILNR